MATFKSGKRGRPLELDIESTYFRFWDLTPLASIRLGKLRQETKGIKIETIALICEALNITLEEFFADPLFKDVQVKD